MNRTHSLAAALSAAMLVLAGCTGGVPLGADGTGDAPSDGAGTVTLYVSDRPGAMADFEHLNVTVTEVSYHAANASAGNETDTDESGGDDIDAEDGWRTYDVENTTVDLTELQGENATVVGQQRLPNGTYDGVVIHVAEANGTLKAGGSPDVKVASGTLKVNERFTVGTNQSLNFVFDATVVEAGQSGKYVLTPVVSESGTDVPIREVEREGENEADVGARFVGPVKPGEATTVKVTGERGPVAGATVTVGDSEFRTAGDGTVTFDLPADTEEVEVEVEYGDAETELTRTFARDHGGDEDRRGGDERADGDRNDD